MSRPHKVCVVIGTRPEVIKTWPVVHELSTRPEFEVQVLLTGQHRELLHQAIDTLKMPVTRDLEVMTDNQTLESLTASLIQRLGIALGELNPDCVLVQGDTTTVFVAALAAFYAGIPVGHIEAGLRSDSIRHPFPEEMNRRLATVLANVHFAPTETAKQALISEGVDNDRVHVTGNTVIDALRMVSQHIDEYPADEALADILGEGSERCVAVTVHRRENQPFMNGIAQAFARLLDLHPDIRIVFPVHLSPAVRQAFEPVLGDRERCHLIDPLDYPNFVRLLRSSHLVLTDSGGVQEEAPFLGKPVLVMRRTTERPEAVEAGTVRIIGEDPDRIVEEASKLLTDQAAYASMAKPVSPYGDGRAAEKIADILLEQVLA